MNALTPLAALLGAANITINLTINGGVFSTKTEVQPEPVEFEIVQDVFYVSPEGVAQHGGLGSDRALRELLSQNTRSIIANSIRAELAPPPKPRPTCGRIVHYHPTTREMQSHGCKGVSHFAALVTAVFETSDGGDLVSAIVFPPGRPPFVPEACVRELEGEHPEFATEAAWSFPARV